VILDVVDEEGSTPGDIDTIKFLANYSVAVSGGRILGTCGLRLWQPDWLEVVSLAVKPDFQRQGIATALIQSIINKGVSLGFNYFFTLTLVPELFKKLSAADLYLRLPDEKIESLKKLLNDELKTRIRRNVNRYRELSDKLEEIIESYENNILNSSKVIEKLIEVAREIQQAHKEGEALGLTEEEMAFYDAISLGKGAIKKSIIIKDFVHDLVKTIKRDLSVDWANNEVIKSRIRSNVRVLLLRNEIHYEDTEKLTDAIYDQAYQMYFDFSVNYMTT